MKQRSYQITIRELETELASLEPRRKALADAIQALKRLVDGEIANSENTESAGLLPKEESSSVSDNPSSEKSKFVGFIKGIFKGLTHRESLLIALNSIGEPKGTKQIRDLLEEAEYKHSSKNLWSTINTTLTRMKESHQVTKTDDGWVLTEAGTRIAKKQLTEIERKQKSLSFDSSST